MAILVKPLFVKKGDSVYECSCYTDANDAVPITSAYGVGAAWEIKNNNTVCYVGLWPFEATDKPPRKLNDVDMDIVTPLVIGKGDKKYYVMRYVLNTFNVTIKGTKNQTIEFNYFDVTNTAKTAWVTEEDVTVAALASTQYSCSITADEGYTKGGLQGASASGYVSESMTISATAATGNPYVMTVDVPTGAVITINDVPYEEGSSAVTFAYNDALMISYAPTNEAQYRVENLTLNGANIVEGVHKMPLGASTITCTSTVRMYSVTVEEGVGTILTVTANGNDVESGSSFDYGTVLNYTVEDADATDAYENPQATAGGI